MKTKEQIETEETKKRNSFYASIRDNPLSSVEFPPFNQQEYDDFFLIERVNNDDL